MRARKGYKPEFKAQIVQELAEGKESLNEVASKHQIAPATLVEWQKIARKNLYLVFQKREGLERAIAQKDDRIAVLERKVGQLTVECDWLGKNLARLSSHDERVRLVETGNDVISVKRQCQCQLLQVNRSSVYRFHANEREVTERQYLAHGESLENLELMRELNELHFEHPAWGYRKMTDYVRNIEHRPVNWKRVRRLMRKVGLETLYPKLNLSKLFHAQYVRPYLLKELEIDHADQVWRIDITYLPLRSGFLYLFIVIDWYSRYIVDYEISFSLEKEFVILCLSRALGA